MFIFGTVVQLVLFSVALLVVCCVNASKTVRVLGISYSIVQGADWHWGPERTGNITDTSNGQPTYIRNSALATFVFAFVFLIMYLVFQVCITGDILPNHFAWSVV